RRPNPHLSMPTGKDVGLGVQQLFQLILAQPLAHALALALLRLARSLMLGRPALRAILGVGVAASAEQLARPDAVAPVANAPVIRGRRLARAVGKIVVGASHCRENRGKG